MKFNNQVVWVTGASSGIGEATAIAFAREGATVLLSSRKKDELERVASLVKNVGSKAHVFPMDMMEPESIIQTANDVLEQFGHIDILFNNAGMSQRSLVEETPVENDRKIMELNFFAQVQLTKILLPIMLKRRQGQIIVTSSITGKFGFPLRSAYAASKHALHGFFESLYIENMQHGIHVLMVIPGRVVTNISYNALTKEGKPHGIMDEGQAGGISSEKCAAQIIKALKMRKREVLIGGKETLMVYIRKYLPPLFYKIASKVKPT